MENLTVKTSILLTNDDKENVYFNATQIAKAYNKRVGDFVRLESTREYLIHLDSILNTTATKTIKGRYNSGTFLSVYLLREFLRWILPIKEYAQLETNGIISSYEANYNKPLKSVYIILADNNNVKVGISSNIKQRFKTIENSSGLSIVDFIFTDKLSKAYDIEQKVLAYFDDYRVNGEWLKGVKYNNVVNKLRHFIQSSYLNETMMISDNKLLINKEN